MYERIFVNPFRCRVWDEHARLEECITAESCKAEIESFLSRGQLVPVLGRRLKGNPSYDVELIYGARRLFVARHLNVDLLVELCELSDRDALVALDTENCKRRALSPYERGKAYQGWLASGYFKSHDDLGRALHISRSQVSRLLTLARLPTIIVSSFASPLDICETWGAELLACWTDPQRKAAVIAMARRIMRQVPRPRPMDVYQQLATCHLPGRRRISRSRDEVVQGLNGKPLFRVKYQRDSVSLVLVKGNLSAVMLDRVKAALADVLQDGSSVESVQLIGLRRSSGANSPDLLQGTHMAQGAA